MSDIVKFGEGLEGHLFLPQGNAAVGAVVILHERYGLVQHTLDLAQKFANDGLVAMAPDLFSRWQGDKEALKRGDVRAVLPDEEVAAVVDGALDYLKSQPRVDAAKLAVMGVCQSGRYSIVVGSKRRDLAAQVVFYGAAQDSDWELSANQPEPIPAMISRLNAPTLYVFGESDHVISIDNVRRLRNAVEDASQSYRMKVFASMPHGWLNDTMPGRYRPAETAEAWQLLLTFLDEAFSRRWPGAGRVLWEFQSNVAEDYDFGKNVRLE